MPEEDKPESNPTEMAGPTRSAETARALIRKTKRATRRRFPTEDKVEGVQRPAPRRRHQRPALLPRDFRHRHRGRD